MIRKALLVCIFMILPALPALAADENVSGVWKTSRFFSDIIAYVEQHGEVISGVLYVDDLFGKRMTYHFTGTLGAEGLTASHRDGHSFQGEFLSGHTVAGTLITKTGYRIKVEVRKTPESSERIALDKAGSRPGALSAPKAGVASDSEALDLKARNADDR